MTAILDVAIVGGGHNGLVTAAYLAKTGLKVGVYEARSVLGGAAVTEEFWPGFRNSSCSYLVGLLSPAVMQELDLADAGLKIVKRLANDFMPLSGNRYLLNTGDADRYKAQLEAFHPGDAKGYDAFTADLDKVVAEVRFLMDQTPPNLGGGLPSLRNVLGSLWGLRRLSPRGQTVLGRLMTQSVAEFLDHYFGGEAVQGGYGYLSAVGNFQSPYMPGTAYVLLHHSFGEANDKQGTWGHAIGGMGSVSEAIARVARKAGAVIETSAPVEKILTRRGTASGILLKDGREIAAKRVAAACNPAILYGKLIERDLVPDEVRTAMSRYRNHSATLRINVALSELPDFACLPGTSLGPQHGGSILISPSLDYLETAYDDAKRGDWSKRPVFEMWISSTVDPTLAPHNGHVASLFCQHFHKDLSGGRNWDTEKEKAADAVIATLTEYAPNFARSVLGRKVLSPKDLDQEYHLTGGDIFHGALHLDQIFSMRPTPGYADYRTPVPGLYLCGSGAHPGGGVTGIPGRNAAREILSDITAFRPRKPGR